MRFKGLDLNLLVALDALLAEKSVSAAARRVFRSQSAMSGSLAKLREHFQDELLVPVGRTLVLTALAESLVGPIQRLMEQIDQTVDVGARFDPATSQRRFILCVTNQILEVLMPDVVIALTTQAPNVVLEMVSASMGAPEMLENGQADLLIVAETAASRLHYAELLYEDDYVTVGWSGNEQLSRPLDAETFFSLGRVAGRFGRSRAFSFPETQMQRFPQAQKIEVVTPSFSAIPRFLIGTNRIAIMPRTLARWFARDLPLVIAPLPVDIRPIQILMQNNLARTDDAGLEWLKAIIRTSVAATHKSI